MIDVKNLHKSFADHEVLKGVTEHIEKGEKVVVIGPSGSGKSTFLRCLNLLEEPTSGEIIFEGKNITDKSTDINLIRRKMGMVFQQFNLFPHLSVKRNITLAPVRLKLMSQSDADKKAIHGRRDRKRQAAWERYRRNYPCLAQRGRCCRSDNHRDNDTDS